MHRVAPSPRRYAWNQCLPKPASPSQADSFIRTPTPHASRRSAPPRNAPAIRRGKMAQGRPRRRAAAGRKTKKIDFFSPPPPPAVAGAGRRRRCRRRPPPAHHRRGSQHPTTVHPARSVRGRRQRALLGRWALHHYVREHPPPYNRIICKFHSGSRRHGTPPRSLTFFQKMIK